MIKYQSPLRWSNAIEGNGKACWRTFFFTQINSKMRCVNLRSFFRRVIGATREYTNHIKLWARKRQKATKRFSHLCVSFFVYFLERTRFIVIHAAACVLSHTESHMNVYIYKSYVCAMGQLKHIMILRDVFEREHFYFGAVVVFSFIVWICLATTTWIQRKNTQQRCEERKKT